MDFVLPRDRDAWPTIRGFVTQVELTIRRWLGLETGSALELERGEDIDEIVRPLASGEQIRVVEQVKRRDNSLTLRSDAVLEAIANFAEHRRSNCGKTLF